VQRKKRKRGPKFRHEIEKSDRSIDRQGNPREFLGEEGEGGRKSLRRQVLVKEILSLIILVLKLLLGSGGGLVALGQFKVITVRDTARAGD